MIIPNLEKNFSQIEIKMGTIKHNRFVIEWKNNTREKKNCETYYTYNRQTVESYIQTDRQQNKRVLTRKFDPQSIDYHLYFL